MEKLLKRTCHEAAIKIAEVLYDNLDLEDAEIVKIALEFAFLHGVAWQQVKEENE